MDCKKSNMKLIYLLMFVSFLLATLQFVFSGILDQVAASIGISVSLAGQLVTFFALGSAVGTPIIMIMAAQLDRKKLSIMALTAILVSTVMTSAANGFAILLAARIILGIGYGVYMVSAYSIIVNASEKGRMARSMAYLAMGSSTALVIGVPASRAISSVFNWRTIFMGIAGLLFIMLVILSKTLPQAHGEDAVPMREQIKQLRNPKILSAFGATFFMFISYAAVNTYTAPYLSQVLNIPGNRISVILILFGLASLGGAILGGHVSDRFSPGKILLIGMFLQTFTLILAAVIPKASPAVIVVLLIWALAEWTCGPILNVNIVTVAPTAAGIMISLNATFIQLGFAAGAALGGITVEIISIESIIWLGAIAVAIAAVLGMHSFKESGRRQVGGGKSENLVGSI